MKKLLLVLIAMFFFFSCSKDELEPSLINWSEKKVIWLGTSIPENQHGEGANINEKLENSYPALLGKLIGCEVINNSRRGLASALDSDGTLQKYGSLCGSIIEYENTIINNENVNINGGENNRNTLRTYENSLLNQNGDFYVFDLIPNNESFNTNEWDKFDFKTNTFNDGSSHVDNRKTYLGSILFLYNELMNDNPLAKVIFVTEYETEHIGVQNTILVSNQLNAPMINLRNLINERGSAYETVDGIHPTQETVDILGEILAEEFSNMYVY